MMRSIYIVRLVIALSLLLALLPTQRVAKAETYIVLYTTDSGPGSLREAIVLANANSGVQDIIEFDIDGCSPTCVIQPTTHLPPLTDDAGVIIDGTTQTDNRGDTNPDGPEIEIDGTNNLLNSIYDNGINITSSNNVIKGLIIHDFPLHGIALSKVSNLDVVSNNLVTANCIGTSSSCYSPVGNGLSGVLISNGATDNIIGGETFGEINVIAGNNSMGVEIYGDGTDNNYLAGNVIMNNSKHGVYIYGGAQENNIGSATEDIANTILENALDGVRLYGEQTSHNLVAGNRIVDNGEFGVKLTNGAHDNIIGGVTPPARNLITANTLSGVVITGTLTMSNTVMGNDIGPVIPSDTEIPNGENGIYISGGARFNLIGGIADGAGNLISGNTQNGILIAGIGTDYNTIAGNLIGTDAAGERAIPNRDRGIRITNGAQYNHVGGDSEAARNVISGNEEEGVFISRENTSFNTITGNFIGTNITGTGRLPNERSGVNIEDSANHNYIGGGTPAERNLISGNNSHGINIAGAAGIEITGNFIGTDISGTEIISNTLAGIYVGFGDANVIGGNTVGERNLISGNRTNGITFEFSDNNIIRGNYIGTDVSGLVALGNGNTGVYILGSSNIIGGSISGAGNLISGNQGRGILITGEEFSGNVISGNLIGTNKFGSAAISNDYGIVLRSSTDHITVGGDTTAERNIISGNRRDGILIHEEFSEHHTISGNYIGTDITGKVAIGNGGAGIRITSEANSHLIGGDTPGEANLISGNVLSGIIISGTNVISNTIEGNLIGTDCSGELPLGNQEYGVYILNGAQNNTIGFSNRIAYNQMDGVMVSGVDTVANTVVQNSIHTNLEGIHLAFGGNGFIEPPEITNASLSGFVGGTACAGCVVEVFWNPTPDGEGKTYLGNATANSEGSFAVSTTLPTVNNLTATATDARGTSEFSSVYNPAWLLYLPITINKD